jgi:hypothetical protein
MPVSKNNAWLHGPARFHPPRFPDGMDSVEGLLPMPAVINLEVGQEIVLYLKDTTPFINTLAKTRPFNLRVHGGVARNQFGCLGFFVFWIPSPFNERAPLAIYDLYVNLRNEKMFGMWRELAFQTHWHMLLLDRKNEQRDFFEFRNTFRIHNFLKEMEDYCHGIPVLDFDKTKSQFMAERSVEDLFHEGQISSTCSESGLSVYDGRFAIPQASDSSNPLRAARFESIFRESVERHIVVGRLPAAIHLDHKLRALKTEVAEKKIIYLDVCHWINLRHVWLQSRLALPVYEQIADRLNRLAERKAVLCPLSVPIFDELMKQLDPRSRAATANLMDIFSQGISVMRFDEAFAEQCRSALNGKGHDVRIKTSSVSKVGMWFGDDQARAAWWSPDIAEAWDNVSIDLRWELTVCDCQKLSTQGFAPRPQRRNFFSKWAHLPAQQRATPKPFWELSRKCRSDVVEDYAAEVISRIESILGGIQRDELHESIIKVTHAMIESKDYGRIPCCEVLAGMCAARVLGGGEIRPNDIFDFLHASAGIPSSEAYFCDGPMEHLVRSKELKLDQHFGVKVHSKPEDLLSYLKTISESA